MSIHPRNTASNIAARSVTLPVDMADRRFVVTDVARHVVGHEDRAHRAAAVLILELADGEVDGVLAALASARDTADRRNARLSEPIRLVTCAGTFAVTRLERYRFAVASGATTTNALELAFGAASDRDRLPDTDPRETFTAAEVLAKIATAKRPDLVA